MYKFCIDKKRVSKVTTDTETSTSKFPIGTVSALTGVHPVTLRAWERRHGLVQPHRTAKGHRLYSEDDVERIREILRLTEEGIPVSQVGDALAADAAVPGESSGGNVLRGHIDAMVSAIQDFDEQGLNSVYNEAMSLYPVEIVTRRLLVPLLQELGVRWANAAGSVAEEHFFSVYMRNKLGARFHHRLGNPQGPMLLLACLPGEQHEFGLLLFALAAHNRGFRIILLGADAPLEEIPVVVRRAQCDAVVLSGTIEPPRTALAEELAGMVRAANVPVFVGGDAAVKFGDEINVAGAEAVGDDLVLGLRRIGQQLYTTTRADSQSENIR